jgi:hypothetical protein
MKNYTLKKVSLQYKTKLRSFVGFSVISFYQFRSPPLTGGDKGEGDSQRLFLKFTVLTRLPQDLKSPPLTLTLSRQGRGFFLGNFSYYNP